METKKRNRIIIIAVLILLFGYFIYQYLTPEIVDESADPGIAINEQLEQEAEENNSVNNPNVIDAASQADLDLVLTDEVAEQQKKEATVKAIAMSFTERIGSYSNQSNFANLIELKPFMTDKMKTWADNFISEQDSSENTEYYGVTARVLSTEILELNDNAGTAIIEVNTQKVESIGSNRDNSVKYQKARLSLLQVDEKWFVDDLKWL